MTPDAVAAALVAGETPDLPDMIGYWRETDAGARPKIETVAVLAALSASPPQAARIEAFVRHARASQPPIRLNGAARAVNIVGAGGGLSTFNISTTACFVAAAAGAQVLKSGSPAYSGKVGASDILLALGLGRATTPEALEAMLDETGIAFAPPSGYAAICKRLALAALPLPFKMIGRFVNGLGPLICPYAVDCSVVGASDRAVFDMLRHVAERTDQRMMLVHAKCGVDELIASERNVIGWTGLREVRVLDGLSCGYDVADISMLAGGDLDHNLAMLQAVLRGTAPVPALQTVALNAGAVLHVAGLAQSIPAGASRAMTAILSGAALDKLHQAQAFAARMRRVALEAVR